MDCGENNSVNMKLKTAEEKIRNILEQLAEINENNGFSDVKNTLVEKNADGDTCLKRDTCSDSWNNKFTKLNCACYEYVLAERGKKDKKNKDDDEDDSLCKFSIEFLNAFNDAFYSYIQKDFTKDQIKQTFHVFLSKLKQYVEINITREKSDSKRQQKRLGITFNKTESKDPNYHGDHKINEIFRRIKKYIKINLLNDCSIYELNDLHIKAISNFFNIPEKDIKETILFYRETDCCSGDQPVSIDSNETIFDVDQGKKTKKPTEEEAIRNMNEEEKLPLLIDFFNYFETLFKKKYTLKDEKMNEAQIYNKRMIYTFNILPLLKNLSQAQFEKVLNLFTFIDKEAAEFYHYNNEEIKRSEFVEKYQINESVFTQQQEKLHKYLQNNYPHEKLEQLSSLYGMEL